MQLLPGVQSGSEGSSGLYVRGGARLDFDWIPGPNHSFKFGGMATRHTFSPGAAQVRIDGFDASALDTLVAPTQTQRAVEANLYLEDNLKLSERLKVNAGVHASLFSVAGRLYNSIQPRISARLLLGRWAIKSSYASMSQYIHLLTNSGIGLPTDLWVPATDLIKPQQSRQVAVGLARSMRRNEYELSIEGYYKSMTHLIEYKQGADFFGLDTDWQNKVVTGEGRSYGVELFLQKNADARPAGSATPSPGRTGSLRV